MPRWLPLEMRPASQHSLTLHCKAEPTTTPSAMSYCFSATTDQRCLRHRCLRHAKTRELIRI